jgi:DNA replication protein DnaC
MPAPTSPCPAPPSASPPASPTPDAAERARLYTEQAARWEVERAARAAEEEARERAAASQRKRERQIAFWECSGVEARHRERQLGQLAVHDAWARAFDAACAIVDGDGILALLGDRGTGKTQLGAELIRRYCLALKSCRYIRCRGIGLHIRRAFAPGARETEAEALEEFTLPCLLVVDEVQELSDKDFAQDTLTYILDCRYASMRPTVLIANTGEDAFKRLVGAAVVDRLREGGGVILFDWPSFRGQVAAGGPS